MDCAPTLAMRYYGSYAPACLEKFCLRAHGSSECEADLAALITEVQAALPVPIRGVIDFRATLYSQCGRLCSPRSPHQLCHFHYFREAAKPVYEADRHAKKELKKHIRGVRPIERELEKRTDAQATVIRQYCLAVRSALTDDGHPPLTASGLKLHERLTLIAASLERVAQKGASLRSLSACVIC